MILRGGTFKGLLLLLGPEEMDSRHDLMSSFQIKTMIEAHNFLLSHVHFLALLLHYDTAQGLLPKTGATLLDFQESKIEISL